jgi:hypothetical protein
MQRRLSKPRRPKDVNQLAYQLVRESTQESLNPPESHQSEISRIMSEMGRKGGKIGGKRRMETLTPAQRSSIALKAARVRWNKPRNPLPDSKT